MTANNNILQFLITKSTSFMTSLSKFTLLSLLVLLTSFQPLKTTLSVSTVTKFPPFSWDKMPLYMHIRKSEAFTNQELRYLAQFPLITFEKTTGSKTYGSTEAGTIAAAEGVKAINPNCKILYYKNAVINWPTYEEDERFIRKNKNALLGDYHGKTPLMPNKKTRFFDLTQVNVREYWLQHVGKMLKEPSIDGVFIDANLKALVPAFFKGRVGKEKQQEIAVSYLKMMQELKEREADSNLILANIIRVRPEFTEDGVEYLNLFDGSYIEGFEHENFGLSYAEYLARGIKAVQKSARAGKIVTMSLGLGEAKKNKTGFDDQRESVSNKDNLTARVDYLLAIFLVCAEKYSYTRSAFRQD